MYSLLFFLFVDRSRHEDIISKRKDRNSRPKSIHKVRIVFDGCEARGGGAEALSQAIDEPEVHECCIIKSTSINILIYFISAINPYINILLNNCTKIIFSCTFDGGMYAYGLY